MSDGYDPDDYKHPNYIEHLRAASDLMRDAIREQNRQDTSQ